MRNIFLATVFAFGAAMPAAAADNVPETDITFEVPTVEMDGYASVDMNDFDTQDLEGEAVWSSVTNERIGDVGEVVRAQDGTIYIEMDIGGFLDIGDKDIVVPLDQVAIYSGDDVRVYIAATEEQLEAYPEYR